jgi:uncharacterized membrane protein YraQ (UPF0718 family)
MGGLGNLASYLAAHVLLCLVPAFFIAGAMTALVPKTAATRFLGRSTPKGLSYPAAASRLLPTVRGVAATRIANSRLSFALGLVQNLPTCSASRVLCAASSSGPIASRHLALAVPRPPQVVVVTAPVNDAQSTLPPRFRRVRAAVLML